MPGAATRHLYLVRHGEATPDESTLTENGQLQAQLLGHRLREFPLSAVHHGPLPRAAETAAIVADQLGNVPLHSSEAAGDYVPHRPRQQDLPPEAADHLLTWLAQADPGDRQSGPELARRAEALFTGPVDGDLPSHQLVVTHTFLIAWLVRAALGAPAWRWLGLAHCHAALTVIRYSPGRPPGLIVYNDLAHLPERLRWTGFPPELRL